MGVRRHHLHPDAARLPLPGRDHGQGNTQGAGLAAIEYYGRGLLPAAIIAYLKTLDPENGEGPCHLWRGSGFCGLPEPLISHIRGTRWTTELFGMRSIKERFR